MELSISHPLDSNADDIVVYVSASELECIRRLQAYTYGDDDVIETALVHRITHILNRVYCKHTIPRKFHELDVFVIRLLVGQGIVEKTVGARLAAALRNWSHKRRTILDDIPISEFRDLLQFTFIDVDSIAAFTDFMNTTFYQGLPTDLESRRKHLDGMIALTQRFADYNGDLGNSTVVSRFIKTLVDEYESVHSRNRLECLKRALAEIYATDFPSIATE